MRRSVYFDFVRGLSAQLVLFGHAANVFFPSYFMRRMPDGQLVAAGDRFFMQNLGVSIFFVLSGYLVTESAIVRSRNGSYGFKAFLLDRICRIFLPFWPALLLVAFLDWLLAAGAAANPYLGQVQHGAYALAMNALMLFNHPAMGAAARFLHLPLQATVYGSAAPFWTVVIEWWLYVSFGVVALLFARTSKLSWMGWLLLVFAIAVPVRQLASGSGLVLAWIAGMTMAYGSTRLAACSRALVGLLAALCLGVAVLALWGNGWDLYDPTVVLGLSVAVILAKFALEPRMAGQGKGRAASGWFSTFAAGLSEYSYSLYLVHFTILMYFFSYLSTGAPWRDLLLAVLLCNLAAIAFWFLFERHYKAVRKAVHRRFHIAGGRDIAPSPFVKVDTHDR